MKAIWSGSISFGLINIPVRLYSAVQAHTLGFKVLCKKCKRPLRYERWCDKCKKEVIWEDVVKGMEIKRGEYFVVTKETLEELRPEKSNQLEIVEFVETDSIAPVYYDHHYYVAPTKEAQKPFALLKDALKKVGLVAIGRFIMREKEYVCAITPYEEGLLLSTLNYAYEIRPIANIPQLQDLPKVTKQEITLAKQLIATLTQKSFDINQFKDTYAEKLKKMIKKRAKGEMVTVLEAKPIKKAVREKKKTLVSELKESLAEISHQEVARS